MREHSYPTIKQLKDILFNLPETYNESSVIISVECNDIIKNSYETSNCELFSLGDPRNRNYLVVHKEK